VLRPQTAATSSDALTPGLGPSMLLERLVRASLVPGSKPLCLPASLIHADFETATAEWPVHVATERGAQALGPAYLISRRTTCGPHIPRAGAHYGSPPGQRLPRTWVGWRVLPVSPYRALDYHELLHALAQVPMSCPSLAIGTEKKDGRRGAHVMTARRRRPSWCYEPGASWHEPGPIPAAGTCDPQSPRRAGRGGSFSASGSSRRRPA